MIGNSDDQPGKAIKERLSAVSWFFLTVFLAAFLLFQVQPLIGRYILPWFGGTPGVWSTSLLFFQTLLLAGYGYANWLASKPRGSMGLHLGLLILSVIVLLVTATLWNSPILPDDRWQYIDVRQPVIRIFIILLASVGLPYFLLTTTSPLLQSWVKFTHPHQTPYRLYALSNLGSLLGLLSYPFLLEPLIGLKRQSWLWGAGYLVVVALCSYLWLQVYNGRQKQLPDIQDINPPDRLPTGGTHSPSLIHKITWLALSACTSILLLAVTHQLTQEIAVIPFLWVLPLGIYLFSFMLTFSGERFYPRTLLITLLAVATFALAYRMNLLTSTDIFTQIGVFLSFLLFATLVCHGELYRLRPKPGHLTSYYLYIALGGVIGALFVNFLAPVIFSGYWELHVGVLLCWLLVIGLINFERPSILDNRWAGEIITVLLILIGISGYLFIRQINNSMQGVVEMQRNFYGVLRIQRSEIGSDDADIYVFKHGTTIHGSQLIAEEKRHIPTAYYGNQSGAGLALSHYSESLPEPSVTHDLKVGIIGLGVGTLAAYGEPGDIYRFYEINPDVIGFAKSEGNYFSYLEDSLANITIIPGDARISLETELRQGQSQAFDLLIIDAFSSDAIPTHLLTVEAFDLYLDHLKSEGVLAVHTSNRYLDLNPLVRGLADYHQLDYALIINRQDDDIGSAAASWMLLSRNPTFFQIPEILQNSQRFPTEVPDIRVWTDDYANLLQLIKKDLFDITQ